MANPFKQILEEGVQRGTVPRSTMNAIDWFRKSAKNAQTINKLQKIQKEVRTNRPGTILKMGAEENPLLSAITKSQIGQLFLFEYDPKTKNTPRLPYYDRFPLVFPMETVPGGFVGMNLHYIGPGYRAALMDSLLDIAINEGTSKMQLPKSGLYTLLNKSAKYRYFRPCIKRYIKENVQSRYMRIPPNEWDIAMFLPLERFKGEKKLSVWNESREKI